MDSSQVTIHDGSQRMGAVIVNRAEQEALDIVVRRAEEKRTPDLSSRARNIF